MLPEIVVAESGAGDYSAFSAKLDGQLANWATLTDSDNSTLQDALTDSDKDTDDGKALIDLYEKRVKADGLASASVSAFKDYIDTNVSAKFAADAEFVPVAAEYQVVKKQYFNDYLKATIAQAQTLVVLDDSNAADYEVYLEGLAAGKEIAKTNLQDA